MISNALADPRAQVFLHGLSAAEGTAQHENPYAVSFGGSTLSDLSAHPGTSRSFTQTDGKKNTTTAAGAYQFTKGTWDEAAKALNLTDFGPESQDKAALYLAHKHGALDDILSGNFRPAVDKLGGEWASLPSSRAPQNKRSEQFMADAFAKAADRVGQSSGGQTAAPGQPGGGTGSGAYFGNDIFSQPDSSPAPDAASTAPQSQGFLDKAGNWLSDAVTRINDHPLQAVDDAMRGVANGLTFGYADKAAAAANSAVKGTAYDDEIKAQRAQTEAGGPIETLGELGSGFLLPVGATGAAMKALPTASRTAKVLAGAGAGAVEGGLNYTGRTDGPIDAGNLAASAALGGLLGGTAGAITPHTVDQRAETFLRGSGSDIQQAARDAQIVQDARKMFGRSTQGDTVLQAAQANQLANSYTQQAQTALRDMPKSDERQALLRALDGSDGKSQLSDEALNALRASPAGDIVANAIQMRQRAMSLTAATPAGDALWQRAGRFMIDNGGGHVLGAAGLAHGNPLGLAMFTQAGRDALKGMMGMRQTRTANIQALLDRGENAAAFLQKYPTVGQSGFQQGIQDLNSMAQQATAKQAADNLAKAAANQANKDPTNIIGLGNPNGVPRNAKQMTEFSDTMRHWMENSPETQAAQAQMAQQAAAQQAQQALAAQQARNELTKATRMPLGGGYQELLQGGRSGLNMTSAEANAGLRVLANHPTLSAAANEMRHTGAVADTTQFYALQNALRGLKEKGMFGGVTPASVMQSPGMTMEQAMRLAAYKAGAQNRQKLMDAVAKAAPNGDMEVLARVMGAEPSKSARAGLLKQHLEGATGDAKTWMDGYLSKMVDYANKQ